MDSKELVLRDTGAIEDLAYTAGLLDGEGCINIAKIKPYKNKRMISPNHTLRVTISNTNSLMGEWLQDNFGGNIQVHHPQNRNWKDRYNWVLSEEKAKNLLVALLPYLKIKIEQAKIGIEFYNTRLDGKPFNRKQKLPDILIEKRDHYKNLLHSFNKRGKPTEEICQTN